MCGDVPPTPSLSGKPILDANPGPKPSASSLPILVVLFVISYSLLTLLVFEQGRTIQSQRALIQSLFQDSAELNHLKIQALQTQRAPAQAQAEATEHSQVKTPSTQDKKQDPKKIAPNASKPKPVPPKPDLYDLTYVRNVITI
jgi:outer membrane biosynthesis protein TonB